VQSREKAGIKLLAVTGEWCEPRNDQGARQGSEADGEQPSDAGHDMIPPGRNNFPEAGEKSGLKAILFT
jgi:hypothetical protein